MYNSYETFINRSIISNMSEGILTVSMHGDVISANAAAFEILSLPKDVIGQSFAGVFFGTEDANDDFVQAFLDAIYNNTVINNTTVSYVKDGKEKQLFISTFFLKDKEEKIGVSSVFSDITEINGLRDAVKAMEEIRKLNNELEKRNAFIKKTFGRFLSDEIVESILETKDGLSIGGKKQYVTIMFTDIRGFTALAEKLDPEVLIAMLNRFLERMTDVIQENNGTILEFIGDAILAVFGAPVESDHSEYDAVKCAIEMQQAMPKLNEVNTEKGLPSIAMGIGIHSGEAIVGNIGSMKKMEYDIIGKNVNLASRIETYTVGGQIYISEETKEAIKDKVKLRGSLPIMPKGVAHEITIYDVEALDNISVPKKEQHFRKPEKPMILDLVLLEGKHAGEDLYKAEVLELSEEEAVITSEAGLKVSQNIVLKASNEDVYAKVLEVDEDRARLHITAGALL